MEVVRGAAGEILGFEALDALSLDDENIFAGLEPAGDFKEGFLGDDEAQFLEKLGANDGVGDAGFIFEADEDKSFGGAGALTADDIARDGDDLSFTAFHQVDGTPDIRQLGTQQGHGMRTGGKAHSFVIRAKAFRDIHGSKR